MLPYMKRNSCISATRITCICLDTLGFKVEPLPTKFYVEMPRLNLAYTSGVSRSEVRHCRGYQLREPEGWNGHLVTLVNSRWIIDSAFDQIGAVFASHVKIPAELPLFPMPKPLPENHGFHVSFEWITDEKAKFRIQYATTTDQSWKQTPAWNDEGLVGLSMSILEELRKVTQ